MAYVAIQGGAQAIAGANDAVEFLRTGKPSKVVSP